MLLTEQYVLKLTFRI